MRWRNRDPVTRAFQKGTRLNSLTSPGTPEQALARANVPGSFFAVTDEVALCPAAGTPRMARPVRQKERGTPSEVRSTPEPRGYCALKEGNLHYAGSMLRMWGSGAYSSQRPAKQGNYGPRDPRRAGSTPSRYEKKLAEEAETVRQGELQPKKGKSGRAEDFVLGCHPQEPTGKRVPIALVPEVPSRLAICIYWPASPGKQVSSTTRGSTC